MTAEDFLPFLVASEMQLWVAIEDKDVLAAMITQIIPYPRKRVLRILVLAGAEMDKWLPFLPEVEKWAKDIGCSHIECWGRKGWLKVLSDWKNSYHILTKEL